MTQTKRGWFRIVIGVLTGTVSACSGQAIDFNSQGGSHGLTGGQSNTAAGGYTAGAYPTNGGSHPNTSGGASLGMNGGASGGGAINQAGKGGVIPEPGDGVFDCSRADELCQAAPDGHVIAYADESELSSLIVGAWLRCSGNAFPERGAGILISADHTWNSLDEGNDTSCKRVETGFDYYGTWTAQKTGDLVQFNLLKIGGGGAFYFPIFSDTGRLRLDPGGAPTEYVKATSLH